MVKRLSLRLLWLLCLALLPAAAHAASLVEPQIGFSAERTLVVDGHTYQGKIWAMPGKERHEQTIQGLRPIFLLRADRPLAEIVVASIKTIVQLEMPPQLRLLDRGRLKQRPVGRDTVNGIATTRYAIDEVVPEGHAKGMLWFSRDDIPMRADGTFIDPKGKVTTVRWELSKVKIGPQPADLFEAPQGYSKLPPEAVAPLLGLKFKSAGPPK
jgi:hypothetical protein